VLELLQTIKIYFEEHSIHGELILLIGITAIYRKLITMDYEQTAGMETIGLGVLIAAFRVGVLSYYKNEKQRRLIEN